MRSLHLLLVFLKQSRRVTCLLAIQVKSYLLAANFLNMAKATSVRLEFETKTVLFWRLGQQL